jgi:hypothetical protein
MNLLRDSSVGACISMAGILGACAAGQTMRPECNEAVLAHIEAAYVAEAIEACAGQRWEECEDLPVVRAKYDALREGWVQCR